MLRAHNAGTGKPRPRVISLYTELTSLLKLAHETVTDYVTRAKTAATALKNADETSDGTERRTRRSNINRLLSSLLRARNNSHSGNSMSPCEASKTLS